MNYTVQKSEFSQAIHKFKCVNNRHMYSSPEYRIPIQNSLITNSRLTLTFHYLYISNTLTLHHYISDNPGIFPVSSTWSNFLQSTLLFVSGSANISFVDIHFTSLTAPLVIFSLMISISRLSLWYLQKVRVLLVLCKSFRHNLVLIWRYLAS